MSKFFRTSFAIVLFSLLSSKSFAQCQGLNPPTDYLTTSQVLPTNPGMFLKICNAATIYDTNALASSSVVVFYLEPGTTVITNRAVFSAFVKSGATLQSMGNDFALVAKESTALVTGFTSNSTITNCAAVTTAGSCTTTSVSNANVDEDVLKVSAMQSKILASNFSAFPAELTIFDMQGRVFDAVQVPAGANIVIEVKQAGTYILSTQCGNSFRRQKIQVD